MSLASQFFASQIDYNKVNDPLVHLFAKNQVVKVLNGRIEAERLSGATRINRFGILETIDNDLIREESDGFLFEGSAIKQNTNFPTGWSGNATLAPNSADGVDDVVNSAFKIVESSNDEAQNVDFSFTSSVGVSFTLSVFASPDDNDYIALVASSNFFQNGSFTIAYFDLVNGQVVSVNNSNVEARISKKLHNGFYRCEITAKASEILATTSSLTLRNSRDGITSNYQGDGVRGISVQNPQIENTYAGASSAASSHVPDSVGTRAINDVSFPAKDNFPNLFGEYTFLFEIIPFILDDNLMILGIDTLTSGTFEGFFTRTDDIGVRFGDTLITTGTGTVELGNRYRVALTSDGTNQYLYLDGVLRNITTFINPENPLLDSIIKIASSANNAEYNNIKLLNLMIFDKYFNVKEIRYKQGIL